jgi:hypothetical protein
LKRCSSVVAAAGVIQLPLLLAAEAVLAGLLLLKFPLLDSPCKLLLVLAEQEGALFR